MGHTCKRGSNFCHLFCHSGSGPRNDQWIVNITWALVLLYIYVPFKFCPALLGNPYKVSWKCPTEYALRLLWHSRVSQVPVSIYLIAWGRGIDPGTATIFSRTTQRFPSLATAESQLTSTPCTLSLMVMQMRSSLVAKHSELKSKLSQFRTP